MIKNLNKAIFSILLSANIGHADVNAIFDNNPSSEPEVLLHSAKPDIASTQFDFEIGGTVLKYTIPADNINKVSSTTNNKFSNENIFYSSEFKSKDQHNQITYIEYSEESDNRYDFLSSDMFSDFLDTKGAVTLLIEEQKVIPFCELVIENVSTVYWHNIYERTYKVSHPFSERKPEIYLEQVVTGTIPYTNSTFVLRVVSHSKENLQAKHKQFVDSIQILKK